MRSVSLCSSFGHILRIFGAAEGVRRQRIVCTITGTVFVST